MLIEPQSDETGHTAQELMRQLLRTPKVAWVTVMLVLCSQTLFVAALFLALFGLAPPLICAFMATLAAYMAFTGMHEAAHMAIGRDARLCAIAGELCAMVLLARFQAFRQVHLRHHRFTNEPHKDPDRWTGIGPRWQLPLRWATADLNYYGQYDAHARDIPRWQEVLSLWSLIALLTLAVALVTTGHGAVLVWVWVVPARIALFLAAYIADYVPHMRPHGLPRRDHRYRHTAVIRGRFMGLLLLGHNLHLVHHLYPAVPFYRCARIWRVKRAEWLKKGAREVSLFSWSVPLSDAAQSEAGVLAERARAVCPRERQGR